MRVLRLSWLMIALLGACLSAHAAAPELAAGQPVADGGDVLAVGRFSAPEVVDWNNDGRLDLVVGQYNSGNINLFLNTTTSSLPRFDGGSYIESDGAPITTSYG